MPLASAPDLTALRRAIETAAGVDISVRAPAPGLLDTWFAWANRSEDDNCQRSHTIATADGDSHMAVLVKLGMELAPHAMAKLDAALEAIGAAA